VNFEADFDLLERRITLHLQTQFPKLGVRKYPSNFKAYLPSNAHGELLVLLQRLDHPQKDASCSDPACPAQGSARFPSLEVSVILAVADDDGRERVSMLLAELRKAMATFLLPLPTLGAATVPGQWEVSVIEEKFLVEEEGVWFYGTLYGIAFHPAFPLFIPRNAPVNTSQGVLP
jgi:hypothetical protein